MGTWRRPSWTAMVWPTISGKMVESRDQVRTTSLRPPEFIATTRFINLESTYGPFFKERDMSGSLPHDELVGRLAAAGLLAHGHLAPLGLRLAADGRFALATAMRMVAWVHGRAANGGAEAHVARSAGFANRDRGVLGITDLAQGGHALDEHEAHLARRESDLCPRALF